jgi:gluconate 2-dehydrogenase gamma chain
MNRRDFLQCAALLVVGGSGLRAQLALSQEQQAFLAAQPDYINRGVLDLFTPLQRAAVSAMAEQVIPATDTPGAIDAGVPRFIELMVSDWFNASERELFMRGLEDVQQRAGGDFAALDRAEQLRELEQMEQASADSGWYSLGNVMRIWDDGAPFICQFKELTVLGFMLSEVGGTQFLRENPMGSFNGSLPLASGDPAYVAQVPIRQMAQEAKL